MLGGREPGHVRAGLGDHDVSGQGADPRDRADQLPESLKGLDHHLDPVGQGLDRDGVAVDQVQVHPGQERVMLAEPSGQRLGQFRDLNRPGSDGGSQSMEDESHGGTQEVPRRAA